MIQTTIEAICGDDKPAKLDVTVSAGEFNGLVIETHSDGDYTLAELNIAQARELIAALQSGIAYLAELNA